MDLTTINWKELEKEIERRAGIPIKLHFKEDNNRNGYVMNFKSDDLSDTEKFLKVIFKEVYIDNFGGGLTESGDGYWVPVQFSWKQHGGGSNGTEFFVAIYEFATKKWIFR